MSILRIIKGKKTLSETRKNTDRGKHFPKTKKAERRQKTLSKTKNTEHRKQKTVTAYKSLKTNLFKNYLKQDQKNH